VKCPFLAIFANRDFRFLKFIRTFLIVMQKNISASFTDFLMYTFCFVHRILHSTINSWNFSIEATRAGRCSDTEYSRILVIWSLFLQHSGREYSRIPLNWASYNIYSGREYTIVTLNRSSYPTRRYRIQQNNSALIFLNHTQVKDTTE
jgi:hypothetical protein